MLKQVQHDVNGLKVLMGFLPGMTLGMWLRGVWFCVALCVCNPSDDAPMWLFVALVLNVIAAAVGIYVMDRERWKVVGNALHKI